MKINSVDLACAILMVKLECETESIVGLVRYLHEHQNEHIEIAGNAFNFGAALEAMRGGGKVCRRGWNGIEQGKKLFVVLMPELYLPPFNTQETGRKVNDRTARWIGDDTPLDSRPYFAMYNNGPWQPGWVPSVSDCLATDWIIAK